MQRPILAWVPAWEGQRGAWCGCSMRARRVVGDEVVKAVQIMALGFQCQVRNLDFVLRFFCRESRVKQGDS